MIKVSIETEVITLSPVLNELYLAIVIVIALLVIITLVMVVMITALCIKRSQYKKEQLEVDVSNLNDTSLNNPVYEGEI